jgi:hypothetical protein
MYLKCPRCSTRTRMEILAKIREGQLMGRKVELRKENLCCSLCGKEIFERDRSA